MKHLESLDWGGIASLSVMLGVAVQILPAVAALLAVVYYGFVIYDRIRYGPELERRMLMRSHKRRPDHHENG